MMGTLPIAWICPPDDDEFKPSLPDPGLELIPVRFGELNALEWEKPGLRAVVIDFGPAPPVNFAASVRSALAACPVPAVVRILPEQLAETLPALRAGDDVCLRDDAPALVAHRIRRLLSANDLDPLTQLLNRRAFYARLGHALLAARPESPLSILFIDIDHFKAINDAHGYVMADRVLESCAGLFQSGDCVLAARVGGEEFAIIAPGLDETVALLYAAQVCGALAAHQGPEGIKVTASIGVATTEGQELNAEAFVGQAALAQYAAKGSGRNRAVHFRGFEREAVQTGSDVQVRALETLQRVVSDRATQAVALRSRKVFDALQKRADHDGLTGLFNRGYMDRRLPRSFQDARGTSTPLCVALIDVDHFGEINKTLGWPTGDQALRDLADLVRQTVRAGDWVARYGGEEIAVVLEGPTCDEAAQVIERVRTAVLRHPFRSTDGTPLTVTVSAGVAELQPGETLQELWVRVSGKLREAKTAGRNAVRH